MNKTKILTEKIVTDLFNKLDFRSIYPDFGIIEKNSSVLFFITNENNLIYFINFRFEDDEYNDGSFLIVSGDMFFITPNGCLASDWIMVNKAVFIKDDIKENFVITYDPKFDIDFNDFDKLLNEYWNENVSGEEKNVLSEEKSFIKSNIEIL